METQIGSRIQGSLQLVTVTLHLTPEPGWSGGGRPGSFLKGLGLEGSQAEFTRPWEMDEATHGPGEARSQGGFLRAGQYIEWRKLTTPWAWVGA